MRRQRYVYTQDLQIMHYLSELDYNTSDSIKRIIFTDAIKLCNRMAYQQYIRDTEHVATLEEFVVRYSIIFAQYHQTSILDYISAYLQDYLLVYNLQGNVLDYTDLLISYIQEITQRIGSLDKDQK